MLVNMGYTNERALSTWDVWKCEGPMGMLEVLSVGGRFCFDVDVREVVLAGGVVMRCAMGLLERGRCNRGYRFESESLEEWI